MPLLCARARFIGDQLDIDASLLCTNERLDDPGPDRQGIGVHEDLTIGSVDRVDRERNAIFLR